MGLEVNFMCWHKLQIQERILVLSNSLLLWVSFHWRAPAPSVFVLVSCVQDQWRKHKHTLWTMLSTLTDRRVDEWHWLQAGNTETPLCWRTKVLREPHLTAFFCYSTIDKQTQHNTVLCQRCWKMALKLLIGFVKFTATLKSGLVSARAFQTM